VVDGASRCSSSSTCLSTGSAETSVAVSPLVGLGGEHTALPLAIVMVVAAIAALLALLWARPNSVSVSVEA